MEEEEEEAMGVVQEHSGRAPPSLLPVECHYGAWSLWMFLSSVFERQSCYHLRLLFHLILMMKNALLLISTITEDCRR